jgi:hypothetical protein
MNLLVHTPWGQKIVAFVDTWLLFRVPLYVINVRIGPQKGPISLYFQAPRIQNFHNSIHYNFAEIMTS